MDLDHRTHTFDPQGKLVVELIERPNIGTSRRYTYGYDPEGNVASVWHHSLVSLSWVPADIPPAPRGFERGSYYMTDSAGNEYNYSGYNFTFAHKLVVTDVEAERRNVATSYSLSQNYPNPFNPSTTIRYGLPQRSHVSLAVYNTLGQQVAQLVGNELDAGFHEVRLNAINLPSGLYLYRLQAGNYVETKKLLLVR
jgi:hypothetical protein